MKERNEDMDHISELNESTKSFIDDLHDQQIINISKRKWPLGGTLVPVVLTNKHGKTCSFTDMREVQRYCKWLIELEAVKHVISNSHETLSPDLTH